MHRIIYMRGKLVASKKRSKRTIFNGWIAKIAVFCAFLEQSGIDINDYCNIIVVHPNKLGNIISNDLSKFILSKVEWQLIIDKCSQNAAISWQLVIVLLAKIIRRTVHHNGIAETRHCSNGIKTTST